MIVNPGIRRFLGSAIQRLFNSASFYAPLTHTAIPTRAAFGTTGTFTRATTSTWPNNDGYMVTGVAGEIGFPGARRVRNLLSATEDFSNAAWSKTAAGAGSVPTVTSGFTDPDGGSTAWRLQCDSGGTTGGDLSILRQLKTVSGALHSIYIKSNTGATQSLYFGTVAANNNITVTTAWQRLSVSNASTTVFDLGAYPGGGVGATSQVIDVLIWHPQLEDVTAQTTQTAGEYVSVGALDYRSELNPLYLSLPGTSGHLVTTPSAAANQIAGSKTIIFRGLQLSSVAPAGYLSLADWNLNAGTGGYSLYQDTGASGKLVYFHNVGAGTISVLSTATLASVGISTTQKCSLAVTHNTTSGEVKFWYKRTDVATPAWTQLGATVASTAGATTGLTAAGALFGRADVPTLYNNNATVSRLELYSGVVTDLDAGTGGTLAQELYPHRDATTPTGTITSSTTGEVWTINGASSVVRSDYYHGSFVDGVKCFATDLAGNALPTSYTYDAVSLNGVAGTYVSTPDSVANSDTGSKDLRFKLFNSNWATGGVITNRNSNNVQFDTFGGGGLLRFAVNHSSVTAFATSDVSPTTVFANNTVGWLRVTYDITSGEVLFYTSSDGVAWDQLGTAQSLPTGAIDEPAGVMSLGSDNVGTNPMPTCRIYSAQIYNGIDGTLAVDFDASRYAGGTTLTGSTGDTWTLNGNAVIHPTNSPMLGYSAEGARTNLCLQSNAFTTTWTALGSPSITQDAIGPDGATSAWTITDNQSGSYYGVQQNLVAWSAGASGCYSILVGKKTSSPSYPCLLMYYNRASNLYHYIIVNEVAGTVAIGGSTNPPAYGCVSFNDDFWLVWVAGTQAGATVSASLDLYPAASVDGTTLSATKQGSTVFCDAQFESGATYPSSRIATTTVAVTRNVDVLTYSSSGNAVVTAGWIYCDAMVPTNNAAPQIQIDDGSNNNRVMFDDGGSSNGGTRFVVQSGGVIQANFTNFSSSANSVQKRCVTWATNYAQSAQGGSLGTGDTSVTVPVSFTQIGVGGANGSAVAPCNIKNLRIGQRQLSSSELQAVTR